MAEGTHTESLQNQARTIANEAKESARSMMGEQQKAAASGVGDLASALRKAAREMGNGGERAPMSRLVESAADGLEHLSGSLRNKDLSGLVRDVESFARRQPVAFFGAAFAAGFLAVRFLKAGGERDRDTDPLGGNSTLPY